MGLPDVGLAPGALFTVASVNLLYLTPVDAATATIRLSTGGGPAVKLPIVSSNGFELMSRIPPDFPLGAAEVQLLENEKALGAAAVTIKPASFGLFTRWGTGSGPALAQNVKPEGLFQNSLANAAAPGQFVTLWGTGLGRATNVSVVVDGTPVVPTYAGPAPSMPGVDQINIKIPVSRIRNLCYVPLRVSGADWRSNAASLSIATPGGHCVHPLGLTAAALDRLDAGGEILFGEGGSSSSIEPGAFPNLDLNFSQHSLSEGVYLDLRYAGEREIDIASAPLQATVELECSRLNSLEVNRWIGFFLPGDANAGDSLTFAGPNGTTMSLSGNRGSYSASRPQVSAPILVDLPPTVFPAGDWALKGPGGLDIGPFGFDSFIPPQIHWTNREQFDSVDRSADLTITWDTRGLRWDDIVTVSISESVILAGSSLFRTVGATCTTIALAGQATIPSALMQTVLSTALTSPRADLKIELTRRSDYPTIFPLPPAAGGVSGAGRFTYSRSETRSTRFRAQ